MEQIEAAMRVVMSVERMVRTRVDLMENSMEMM